MVLKSDTILFYFHFTTINRNFFKNEMQKEKHVSVKKPLELLHFLLSQTLRDLEKRHFKVKCKRHGSEALEVLVVLNSKAILFLQ